MNNSFEQTETLIAVSKPSQVMAVYRSISVQAEPYERVMSDGRNYLKMNSELYGETRPNPWLRQNLDVKENRI